MIDDIHWLGHDTFRLDGSSTVYIDPWKLPVGAPPADLILVTHDHFDHFSPGDIAVIARPTTKLIGPASVTAQAQGVAVVTLGAGESTMAGDVTVTAVPAYNLDKFREPGEVYHPRAAGGLGYIVELDGRRIYHAGDTDAIPEMREVRCDVALLPVSGTYVMTAAEAAEACRMISATAVVPMHFGDIVGTAADAARFESLCGIPVTVLPLERG
jgi:L-ascorbate metabolism protein UlaG (beta-lactamase superfamily)